MEKQTILSALKEGLIAKTISEGEVKGVLHEAGIVQETKKNSSITLSKILYTVGGLIVFIGIIVLIVQNWTDLGFIGRLTVTLGVGVMAYITAIFFTFGSIQKALANTFYGLAYLVLPIGFYVLIVNNGASGMDGLTMLIIISGSMFVIAAASYLITRMSVPLLFTFINGTWLYYVAITNLIDIGNYQEINILYYATMLVGVAYYFYGHLLKDNEDVEKKNISDLLYFAGTAAILGPGIALGGVWDVLFIGLVFGLMMFGVFTKQKVSFVLSCLFLMGYLIKISAKYFADSLGWPLALVIGGLMIIAIGYGALYVNRKYISK